MLRLTLENFRRYRTATQIDFQPGLTVVSGENGAGKTTLTEAVLYALFGNKRGQSPKSDDAAGPLKVSLTFKTAGASFCVTCRDAQCQLIMDGQIVVNMGAGSRAATTQRLQKLLGGLNRKYFEKVYFALQGQTEALVAYRPEDRKKLIEDVLQLDVVKKAVELQKTRYAEALELLKTEVRLFQETTRQLVGHPDLSVQRQAFHSARNEDSRSEQLGSFLFQVQEHLERHQTELDRLMQNSREAAEAGSQTAAAADEAARTAQAAEASELAFEVAAEQEREINAKLNVAIGQQLTLASAVKEHRAGHQAALSCEPEAQAHAGFEKEHQKRAETLDRYLKQRVLAVQLAQASQDLATCEAMRLDFANVNTELHTAESGLHAAQVMLNEIDLDPSQEAFTTIGGTELALEQKAKEVRQSLNAISELQGLTCPVCNAVLTEHTRSEREDHLRSWLANELPVALLEIEARKSEATSVRESWTHRRQTAKEQVAHLHEAQTQARLRSDRRDQAALALQSAQEKRNHVSAQCVASGVLSPFDTSQDVQLQQRVDDSAAEMKRLAPARAHYDRREALAEILATKECELTAQQHKISWLQHQLEAVGYDTAAHQQARDARKETTALHLQAREAADKAEVMRRDAIALFDVTNKVKSTVLAARVTVDTAQEATDQECLLLRHLSDFERHFFVVNTHYVMQRASMLIRTVAGDSILGLELEESGHLLYRDSTQTKRDVERLSGGEKALVGLCLRLALAERAQRISTDGKVRFLVLDEVLSSLDDQRRNQVQLILQQVLHSGLFDYVIMITHLEDVKHNWRAHRLDIRKVDATSSSASMNWLPPAEFEVLGGVSEENITPVTS